MNVKIGDVVQLKSGGPKMTVNEIANTQTNCVWFVGGSRESGNFDPEALEKVHAY